jgi:capsular exopolysaccharide synthesis family protein
MTDSLVPRRSDERLNALVPHPGTSPYRDRPAVEEQSPVKPVIELLTLVRRHWFLILLCGAAAFGFSRYLVRNQLPVFQSAAVMRYSDRTRGLSGQIAANPAERIRAGADPLVTQVQLLKSRTVARAVAQRAGVRLQEVTGRVGTAWLRDIAVADSAPQDTIRITFLADRAAIRFAGGTQSVRYGQRIEDSGVAFTVARNPGLPQASLVVVPLEQAAAQVLRGLDGHPRDRTDIIDVTYSSSDAAMSQRVVNAAVAVFQELNSSTAKEESARRRDFIAQQLAKTDSALRTAQNSYDDFRTANRIYNSQDQLKSQQTDLTGIDVRRQELAADRRMYASLLASLTDTRENPATAGQRLNALLSSPGIAQNPVVAQVYAQLLKYQGARDSLVLGRWASAPTNPDVRRLDTLISSTQSKLLDGVRGQLASVDARLGALDSLRASASRGMASLPEIESREANLVAQVDADRRESELLRQELQKAQIEQAAEGGQIDIVDLAQSPGAAVASGRTQSMIVATVLGLLLGTAAAFLLENRKSIVRRREELERVVHAPNLALVPRISMKQNGKAHGMLARIAGRGPAPDLVSGVPTELVTLSDIHGVGAEAYRTLRTNLLFSSTGSRLRRLLVTSPGPQEGKSTTVSNLAVAFAQQGHRTVLIDCDLRRPRLHNVFRQPQCPGMSELLTGQSDMSAVVAPTMLSNLSLITAGHPPPNPAELLGSERMQEVLAELTEAFDLVLIDTPPILAASDPAILSKIVDGVVIVVRAGATERGAIHESVRQLTTVNARILGTVLNDPDAEVERYAGYYGYYYNNYYRYSSQTG